MFDNAFSKTALFIDGSHLFTVSRALNFQIDYKRLLDLFNGSNQEAGFVRAYYYATLVQDSQGHISLRGLMDWLEYNGYTVRTKSFQEHVTEFHGERRVTSPHRSNMAVMMTVDMMELAETIDHAILLTGDPVLVDVIPALQRKGLRVSILSSMKTEPPVVADGLRRRADQFIDLENLVNDICRTENANVR